MILELIMVTASKKLLKIRWEHVEEMVRMLMWMNVPNKGENRR